MRRQLDTMPLSRRRVHWLSAATAGATLVLVLSGGLVTNTGSALAVPDWPTTFGYNMFTYPPSQWVGGVLYEHSHRLLGSLVGMLTIALVVGAWRWEPRPWVRWLAVAALLGVVAQGVLGGLRVVWLRHDLAVIHGCFAQAFFAFIVTLWVVTSEAWERLPGSLTGNNRGRLPAVLAGAVPVAVYTQIVLGALLAHRGQALWEHVFGAGIVATLVVVAVLWLTRSTPASPWLRTPVFALAGLVTVQLSFGLLAYLWHFTALHQHVPYGLGLSFLAAHRLTGTLLWGTSVVFALRMARASLGSAPRQWFATEVSKAWT